MEYSIEHINEIFKKQGKLIDKLNERMTVLEITHQDILDQLEMYKKSKSIDIISTIENDSDLKNKYDCLTPLSKEELNNSDPLIYPKEFK